jgi:hypothetical protein
VTALVQALFWGALGVWLGAVVFFSFVVAPGVFGALPRETAGQVVGSLFSAYYALGGGAGVVALAAAMALRRWAGGSARWTAIGTMLAAMVLATAYAGGVVHPQARALRAGLHQPDATPATQAAFDRLHALAVGLNGGVLLAGCAVVALAAGGFRLRER